LHGHRYEVEVTLKSSDTDETGLSCDFTLIKRKMDDILRDFDHCCLNELVAFKDSNPSAENIARQIYNRMKKIVAQFPSAVILESVTVWESPGSRVEYREE
jgi:6-pyruvoyltetrahydropterin/6-carboxytetrahydropterin synthase